MRIGPHQLRNNLIVAPMAGVTDRPFRQLCKTLGAGMAVSEMVASNSLLWGSEKTKRRANHEGEVDPISVQIVGADPAMLAEAARLQRRAGRPDHRHQHGMVEVVGGLEAGARVVRAGHQKLFEGAKVLPLTAEMMARGGPGGAGPPGGKPDSAGAGTARR